jgi:predicted MFS family arabinose efflux permease
MAGRGRAAGGAVIVSLAGNVRPEQATGGHQPWSLLRNGPYLRLALFFAVALAALYLGYALAPTFLKDARGFSAGYIGFLFSVSAAGTLVFRSVVIRFPPGRSFAMLLGLACLGIVLLWQMPGRVGAAVAFILLGAISTTWVVMQASIGDAVAEHVRGLALGITESLYYGGIALASWLAGQLYGVTVAHDLPLMFGAAAVLVVVVVWVVRPEGIFSPAAAQAAWSRQSGSG